MAWWRHRGGELASVGTHALRLHFRCSRACCKEKLRVQRGPYAVRFARCVKPTLARDEDAPPAPSKAPSFPPACEPSLTSPHQSSPLLPPTAPIRNRRRAPRSCSEASHEVSEAESVRRRLTPSKRPSVLIIAPDPCASGVASLPLVASATPPLHPLGEKQVLKQAF